MRDHESNVDQRAYETHGVSRHPHRSCPTRARTWDFPVNNRTLCHLSYRASAPRASGTVRIELTLVGFQPAAPPACLGPKSGWRDSNPRSPAPKAGGLAAGLHPVTCSRWESNPLRQNLAEDSIPERLATTSRFSNGGSASRTTSLRAPPRNRTLLSGLRVRSITAMLARPCRGDGVPLVSDRVAAADRRPHPSGPAPA